jgi:PKD repeat protein
MVTGRRLYTFGVLAILVLTLIFTALHVTSPVLADTAYTISGTVKDNLGTPFVNADVQVINPSSGQVVYSTTTDSIGAYSISVISGTYNIKAIPPASSNLLPVTYYNQAIIANTVLNFVLVPPVTIVTVSGTIRDRDGIPIPGAAIHFLNISNDSPDITSYTNSSGSYSAQIPAGQYSITILTPNGNVPTSSHIALLLSFTQNTVLDLTVVFQKVTVHVQDAAGNAVPGVLIESSEVVNSFLTLDTSLGNLPAGGVSNAQGTTNASGDVVLWLVSTPTDGAYTFTAYPSANSPFIDTIVSDITITSDITIIISPQVVHPPPVTTATLAPQPYFQDIYIESVTVTLSATAYTGFTIAATYYTIDGGTPQIYSTPFVVSDTGTHTIGYWSVDNIGVIETPNIVSFTIVSNQSPVSNTGGPYSGTEGSSVNFNGISSSDPEGAVLTYAWIFGDSGTATGVSPSHTYTDNGIFNITLTVTDPGGLSDIRSTTATIANVSPAVEAGPDQSQDLGLSFLFNGTVNDPSSVDTAAGLNPIWSFGDSSMASGLSVSHVYSNPGVYTVTLTATDKDGGVGTDSLNVTVVTNPTCEIKCCLCLLWIILALIVGFILGILTCRLISKKKHHTTAP